MKTVTAIEKEQITNLKFSAQEVLHSVEERSLRRADLERAQALGNLLQNKVRIRFETADGEHYEVYTTVWAVGERFIKLKGGVHIPIHCILKIA
ncbi:hypothetical protein A3SI_02753 [Nitritalea halalkaliphila LW7]|uniref:Uncharacterized protein n=1 Tax=Nitritalea halalkaliphila LW7 TaxID=1189621 RepID=I5C9E5_9BACT|nr:hypothetical protein [Nitritalea halalkaliphila]EIM78447.1 hypothetical protein A3SI_02753 [Nitritalea halalkaliphila LW7]